MNDIIEINDLEASFRIGVPDTERANPQKVLITIRLFTDFKEAARTDDVQHTVDYDELTRSLIEWGQAREWKLIETLASNIADWILDRYSIAGVQIEIKKFILPNTRHVGVRIMRDRESAD